MFCSKQRFAGWPRMGFWVEFMALIVREGFGREMMGLYFESKACLERWQRTAYVAGMCILFLRLFLRRLLIFLTGLAFLVGAGAQMPPAASACMDAAQTAIDDCCVRMAIKDHATPALMKQMPCKGISLDCANQVGCISSPALPTLSTALGIPTAYARVAYWPPATWRAGLSIKPNLFPPIANRIAA